MAWHDQAGGWQSWAPHRIARALTALHGIAAAWRGGAWCCNGMDRQGVESQWRGVAKLGDGIDRSAGHSTGKATIG